MNSIVLIVAIIVVDQISKLAVRMFMIEGQSIDIINGFFALCYYENTGVAFSFLHGQRIVVTILQIVCMILVAVFYYKFRGKSRIMDYALVLILAGGIGNLIDRLIFGSVTDMLSFSIFPPIFNVADIAVTVGCGLLILDIVLDMVNQKKEIK